MSETFLFQVESTWKHQDVEKIEKTNFAKRFLVTGTVQLKQLLIIVLLFQNFGIHFNVHSDRLAPKHLTSRTFQFARTELLIVKLISTTHIHQTLSFNRRIY